MDFDSETKQKIEETVTEILRKADMDSATEQKVRDVASENLGMDLSSDIAYKKLVRRVVESFLISMDDDGVEVGRLQQCNGHGGTQLNAVEPPREEHDEEKKPEVAVPPPPPTTREDRVEVDPLRQCTGHGAEQLKAVPPPNEEQDEEKKTDGAPPATTKKDKADRCKVICKLSNRRNVAVRSRDGKTIVSIREFCRKDGKQVPSFNMGCHLTCEQWSTFKNSIPAIENAIIEMESKIRSKPQPKQTEAAKNRADYKTKPIVDKPCQAELDKQMDATPHQPERAGTQVEERPTSPSISHGLHPVQRIRFDGNNYDQWAQKMEMFLNQLNVAYVLSEPCPGPENTHAGTVTAEKWMNDDYICHMNILNSLSDHLFDLYAKKPGSAKDLWEELKLMSLYEEHGAKIKLVKKYLEFEMVDGKPMIEQAQELHHIADSINTAGMYVEEKFHVNVIISKFPPSWREFGIQLMREEFLPVWVLMHRLKLEEDSRKLSIRSDVPTINVMPDYAGDSKQHKRPEPRRPLLQRPRPVQHNHEVKYCNYCGKKGHLEEQCWFRKRCLMENNPVLEKETSVFENAGDEVKGVGQAKASELKKD